MTYQKFIDIQTAWMNFDYNALSKLCTNELYNSYKTQLETLKLKKGQNIMSDFELLEAKVTRLIEDEQFITVTVYMKITFYDYVINTQTKKVTRGTDTRRLTNNYIMTFVKAKENTQNLKCPKCGAEIENGVKTCPYCRSKLTYANEEFVLSKKTNIN